jgi:adenine-specific DNA-methyltransferase
MAQMAHKKGKGQNRDTHMAKKSIVKTVETIKHDADKRTNIPTAEYQAMLQKEQEQPKQIRYPRNTDLDPQLVWRGKDEQDWSDLVVHAPPLYIQEKVHPKVLVDDLLRETKEREHESEGGKISLDLFADFNGIPKGVDKTEFYQHDQNWSNRMILGDSLQVMASLAEREGLRGKVQCIFFDPPYGIEFNSNFQWSTTDKAGSTTDSSEKISREPEQVKAFRDTWRDGIHSYLTYLRDRFTVIRDLLNDSGSIFIQIGDKNVHRVRSVMDEVFGESNFVALIPFRKKTMPFGSKYIEQMADFILWYAKAKTDSKGNAKAKYRKQFSLRSVEGEFHHCWYEDGYGLRTRMSKHQLYNHALLPPKSRVYRLKSLEPSGRMDSGMFDYEFRGKLYHHPANGFGTTPAGLKQVEKSNRLEPEGNRLCYVLYADEGESSQMTAPWSDTVGADDKQYVVQTNTEVIKRCILMTTDPGDLVLDPTCGSGTTAYVSEQWGRRWITIDTSRVALALARARIMGARYPFYLLSDSREGQIKEAEVTRSAPSSQPVQGNIRQGFVYERMPRITLGSIAHNTEIDVIWDKWQSQMVALREALNTALKKSWQEWEIPRKEDAKWPDTVKNLFDDFWLAHMARQKEINSSIAAKAESTYLFDRPYDDKKIVRVAGPFTVESLSPHRMLGVDEDDELIDHLAEKKLGYGEKKDFAQMILENLKMAGVQQAHKEDRITFTALTPWPGDLVCGEGRFMEGTTEKRAAIFIGPEFGTVQRVDLVAAAREAGDAGFDVLIACAFNYEAHTTEFSKLGRIPVLKARMNADLHMAEDLKNTGKGNLFVIFGEPDISLMPEKDGKLRVKVNGVDVFKPQTGEVVSDGADGIACWFIDTDYNEESFFVRHAYFLGANDPYNALKTTLKAEIDHEAWETLHSDTSRPFGKPTKGRIAVKVINHLGDEVMKVFKV